MTYNYVDMLIASLKQKNRKFFVGKAGDAVAIIKDTKAAASNSPHRRARKRVPITRGMAMQLRTDPRVEIVSRSKSTGNTYSLWINEPESNLAGAVPRVPK